MTKDKFDWRSDRIVGAPANLGYTLLDETVGNILRCNGIPPAPERKHTTTWTEFISAHLVVLAGTDFFTVEVLTLRGSVTYYVLFFNQLENRKVEVFSSAPHPNERWIKQMAGNVTMDEWGFLDNCRYLVHDRETNFTDSFHAIVKSSQVEPLKLPARSPNLNAFAERWVESVKDVCLSKLISFGEASPRRALRNFLTRYHSERNHQGKDNVVLFPSLAKDAYTVNGTVVCRERPGGQLKYYHQEAA